MITPANLVHLAISDNLTQMFFHWISTLVRSFSRLYFSWHLFRWFYPTAATKTLLGRKSFKKAQENSAVVYVLAAFALYSLIQSVRRSRGTGTEKKRGGETQEMQNEDQPPRRVHIRGRTIDRFLFPEVAYVLTDWNIRERSCFWIFFRDSQKIVSCTKKINLTFKLK